MSSNMHIRLLFGLYYHSKCTSTFFWHFWHNVSHTNTNIKKIPDISYFLSTRNVRNVINQQTIEIHISWCCCMTVLLLTRGNEMNHYENINEYYEPFHCETFIINIICVFIALQHFTHGTLHEVKSTVFLFFLSLDYMHDCIYTFINGSPEFLWNGSLGIAGLIQMAVIFWTCFTG